MFNQPPQTMFSKPTLLILLAFLPAGIFSQGVRGTIVDEQGNPLPNVSIYIPEERTGTITNINGNYEISLPGGEYDLVFQSLGFKQRTFNLTIRDTWIDIDLELEPQSYRLREVVINPSGEDPAYAIMRKAIGILLRIGEIQTSKIERGTEYTFPAYFTDHEPGTKRGKKTCRRTAKR